ncbi:MAG TPA: tRNA (adenosine(37)-N6)-threonylcarbamoyltransferase complex transferase subunit TsaD [Algoriphagus sp.]|jgi:N6-L-threonylcarbamoyladenine synthase|uniref:tRNA (adenosine(37)-N6)-threonylcarbamoyltransferase complex transferase subunit TsaD n=1 Tax=unclassified Algoriphagus TaxID=2641541 RepID=UPI000C41FAF1|nr:MULTISPECIES: tRNA (adenosine(37)-N6)-threonylcarbamoyltransferase complex transferase subunit TsaD [unclassified Algoriphagus]MAL13061.1 tRNA (adenosine(37)-N6)-threonylcarbamoyltransferase complex transferase subunit TsaD [Algoriphagus sp.]MAN85827.1 tRNA (adenosine(37)-N6)-threonylcarbamoyltransferase complex transferase subunit TsaD [Algoriphagus sp.]QYH39415.1 tRNA (adenosine(37)-N6)-threonylcarbamoyltransferase complex transferase subunit TsaD [Algoriphagus sp. NBT04N3]HAH36370.1 tRNA |tara:strand:- start:2611 stop:3624 length:1014 start_codon:yes stop_codon:yes gene_type:complete
MDTNDISILAIESSCDETSASIILNGKVLNNIVATQSVHEKYGGVVPELASRAHQENIIPVVHEALESSGIGKKDLSAIAFTRGPGLMGALLVGVSFAKSMAYALKIPLIEINHMQAHVLAHFIEDPKPNFPFICLTVSGGHTQLVLVKDYLDMQVIGETRDDAVGEAFDKTAKLLGLPYPGGPLIDKYAQSGNPKAFEFPITRMPELDYSFSGIKTAVLYFLRDQLQQNPTFIEENLNDLCASIQHSLIEMLLIKLKAAVKQYGVKDVAIAGGVSANSGLRNALTDLATKRGWNIFIPKFEYCTDNAAMIAMAAHYKYLKGDFSSMDVTPLAKMKI